MISIHSNAAVALDFPVPAAPGETPKYIRINPGENLFDSMNNIMLARIKRVYGPKRVDRDDPNSPEIPGLMKFEDDLPKEDVSKNKKSQGQRSAIDS